MDLELAQKLTLHGIKPSAQRLAVGAWVLQTQAHPSADQVWDQVQKGFPMLSRATVYNTLNLFVAHGLLRLLVLSEGKVVFDPRLERHHHFIDDATGRIHDVPWEAIAVGDVSALEGYDVREHMLVLRGRKLGGPRSDRRSRPSAK